MAADTVKAGDLAEIGLFRGMSKKDLKYLAEQCHMVDVARGGAIVTEGEASGRLYVILAGEARVIVNGRARRRLGRGSIIGELSLLDPGPRTATVTADTDVRAATLSSSNFLAALEEFPSMARSVMHTLAKRVRELDKQLT